ncbi:MAG: NAD(P)/FAD-dependent oxidoreductase [Rhodospirillales bacterium]
MTERGRGWAVVGGGLLGLTMAHRLTQAGKRVTVFEAAPQLGGLASAWQLGDVVWDRHYHVIMLSDMSLRNLLGEIGLADELRFDQTRTGFYTGKGFYRMATALDYLKFPALSLIDKVRLAATLMYISRVKDGRALERIPLADWLTRLSGRRVFDQMWRPLLAAKMGDNYKIASASFIWSYVARIYAARRGGMKREMFGYIPGGYARILDRFGERLRDAGVDIQLSAPVEAIERRADGLAVTTPKGTQTFDRVIVTAAGPHAARMAKGLDADEKERLNGIVYQGIICPSALIDRPLAGYYLTYITDGSIPFTAIVEMSALVDKEENFGGSSLVYLPRYVTADDPYWQLDDAEIERRFVAGLSRIYPDPGPANVRSFRVSRVRQVYAISTLNYSDRLPPMVTSVPGLYIVNSAHIVNGTLAVNETVGLADRATPEVLAAAASLPAPSVPTKEHAA